MSTSDFSPGHRAPPRIFANPKESQLAEITQLLFQSGSKTAVDQYLSILFLETANLRRQLYELNNCVAGSGRRNYRLGIEPRRSPEPAAGTRTSDRPILARAIADGWVTPGRPALVIGRAPSEGLLRNGVVRALFALGDFPHPRARIAPTGRQ